MNGKGEIFFGAFLSGWEAAAAASGRLHIAAWEAAAAAGRLQVATLEEAEAMATADDLARVLGIPTFCTAPTVQGLKDGRAIMAMYNKFCHVHAFCHVQSGYSPNAGRLYYSIYVMV